MSQVLKIELPLKMEPKTSDFKNLFKPKLRLLAGLLHYEDEYCSSQFRQQVI